MTGLKPLAGLKVLEFDAIGPVPFCAMMLADHGAEVIRITRPGGQPNGVDVGDSEILLRGRARRIPLDLKSDHGRTEVLKKLERTDVLLEGHRPGVMERLGLGPKECHKINPVLVYCRITGYGQTGPLALHPGHDINYIAQTGALHAIGPQDEPPPPPLSLVGDFGGGGMLGAFGILAAVIAARSTGKGSVIDAAMADGTALLMAMNYGWRNASAWVPHRSSNLLDGAAPFYRCYQTQNGNYIAVGAIEPKFYSALRKALNLDDPIFADQMNRENWPAMSQKIAAAVMQMDETALQTAVETPDACLSWVIPIEDAGKTGHMKDRKMIQQIDGGITVATAPRFIPASKDE
ncbi:CaiB/BaiF CoA-transferase family protein [Labrenzia sp. PHM005]|uniref:CaiB/BaiF CoA transferase family protein n=1 Tax=Labrenzia sp. PHM005 TaxID=2590016 RepID=UPI00114016E4|nr:CoA transferase [Labrenzia sp. PHM005]